MKTRNIAFVPVAGVAALLLAALTACGPNNSSSAAAKQSAKARISAEATSSAAQQAKSDAQTLLKACPVPQGASQLSKAAWTSWVRCAGVPKASWKPAAGCILTHVEKGGKLPKDHVARQSALINDAFPCVQQYHGNAK